MTKNVSISGLSFHEGALSTCMAAVPAAGDRNHVVLVVHMHCSVTAIDDCITTTMRFSIAMTRSCMV